MKKLLFSAVALVAFSSVSMANTIEVEDLRARNCAQEADELIATIELEEGSLSDVEEDYYWYSYYSACMNESTKKK
jgi:hypothetical protein